MKILVTSGATREFIDRVRFISNASTGRLGSLIASRGAEEGFGVEYVHGTAACMPRSNELITCREIISASDLAAELRKRLADTDIRAVIHPMAVSDFKPAEIKNGKISGSTDKLNLTLVPTPKAVREIRSMRPDIILVSFKLETEISEDELIARAQESLRSTGSNAVAANLLEQTNNDESHTAFLVCSDGTIIRSRGKHRIAEDIISFVRNSL